MNYSVEDLEELLSNSSLCLDTAAVEASKVVHRLNTIATKRALEPLEQVEESSCAEAKVQGEVQQVKAS